MNKEIARDRLVDYAFGFEKACKHSGFNIGVIASIDDCCGSLRFNSYFGDWLGISQTIQFTDTGMETNTKIEQPAALATKRFSLTVPEPFYLGEPVLFTSIQEAIDATLNLVKAEFLAIEQAKKPWIDADILFATAHKAEGVEGQSSLQALRTMLTAAVAQLTPEQQHEFFADTRVAAVLDQVYPEYSTLKGRARYDEIATALQEELYLDWLAAENLEFSP